jgi:hypothetical protein
MGHHFHFVFCNIEGRTYAIISIVLEWKLGAGTFSGLPDLSRRPHRDRRHCHGRLPSESAAAIRVSNLALPKASQNAEAYVTSLEWYFL